MAFRLNVDLEAGDLLLPSPRLEAQLPQTPSGALSELRLIRVNRAPQGPAPSYSKAKTRGRPAVSTPGPTLPLTVSPMAEG